MAEAAVTALLESDAPIELRQLTSALGDWGLFVNDRQVSGSGSCSAMELIRSEYERRRAVARSLLTAA